MSAEDLDEYEAKLELDLYREYKDVVGIFTYAVETERAERGDRPGDRGHREPRLVGELGPGSGRRMRQGTEQSAAVDPRER